VSKKEDSDIFLSDQSDGLLMINKEERKLLKQVLLITMGSKNSKAYIVKKFGPKYIQIAEKLLEALGGP